MAHPVPQLTSGQVERNAIQPWPKAGRITKAVQADQRLDGGLLEDIVEVLAPVENPADQCHCRWTVTFHQDGEGRLITAAGPQHQDRDLWSGGTVQRAGEASA